MTLFELALAAGHDLYGYTTARDILHAHAARFVSGSKMDEHDERLHDALGLVSYPYVEIAAMVSLH